MSDKYPKIPSSQITPEHSYRSRRRFMKGAGAVAMAAVLAACGVPSAGGKTDAPASGGASGPTPIPGLADDLGVPANTWDQITTYNNFYEFSTSKTKVARMAEGYPTEPWKVEVGGLVENPRTFDLDDLRKFEEEERIYRLRCVEAWSMVIPWQGFPLSRLLKAVKPLSKAKFVRFQTIYDPDSLPGQRSAVYQWPYIEGLRMDEAMHDLTLLATGLYGQPLPMQNGAPVRLVVPWKYGFKSVKSIVKIDLVEEMPVSLWMAAAPNEYGFYANVNPDVNHPRWSQRTERRIGQRKRIETMMFNGYAEQVASLYADMDLRKNF